MNPPSTSVSKRNYRFSFYLTYIIQVTMKFYYNPTSNDHQWRNTRFGPGAECPPTPRLSTGKFLATYRQNEARKKGEKWEILRKKKRRMKIRKMGKKWRRKEEIEKCKVKNDWKFLFFLLLLLTFRKPTNFFRVFLPKRKFPPGKG